MGMLAQLIANGGVTASAPVPVYVEDVFSTYTYTGTGAAQAINNGLNLAGKGGLVLIRDRNSSVNTVVVEDTVRGAGQLTYTGTTAGNVNSSASQATITSFNSNGFSLGADFAGMGTNASGRPHVSWSFREQPKFFDIVTYAGTGAGRTIAHNLGSVPGCIIVKRLDTATEWPVYHRMLGNGNYIPLNTSGATAVTTTRWNSTTPTASVFSLGGQSSVNASGSTYIAYLFAHNAGGFGASGSDSVIVCDEFVVDASGNATVTLGWEPQFILFKNKNTASTNWTILDTARGWDFTISDKVLTTNAFIVESNTTWGNPTSTGFQVVNGGISQTYIYIAVRCPMKVPTNAETVFNTIVRSGTAAAASVTGVGFSPDMLLGVPRSSTFIRGIYDRKRGLSNGLSSNLSDAEYTDNSAVTALNMDGFALGSDSTFGSFNASGTYATQCFKEAPGFFDIVPYSVQGPVTVNHGLQAVPELIFVKRLNQSEDWWVYAAPVGNTSYLMLNRVSGSNTTSQAWNNTSPTSSVFTVGISSNVSSTTGGTFVAYLFASLAGVSKVGSYTGNGSSQTVNCGFAAGARFVLIKRTDASGDWFVWDTARGIVAANDPHSSLNSTVAEVTTDDSIDPDATGFVVNQNAATNINVTGATYIYLAIA